MDRKYLTYGLSILLSAGTLAYAGSPDKPEKGVRRDHPGRLERMPERPQMTEERREKIREFREKVAELRKEYNIPEAPAQREFLEKFKALREEYAEYLPKRPGFDGEGPRGPRERPRYRRPEPKE